MIHSCPYHKGCGQNTMGQDRLTWSYYTMLICRCSSRQQMQVPDITYCEIQNTDQPPGSIVLIKNSQPLLGILKVSFDAYESILVLIWKLKYVDIEKPLKNTGSDGRVTADFFTLQTMQSSVLKKKIWRPLKLGKISVKVCFVRKD